MFYVPLVRWLLSYIFYSFSLPRRLSILTIITFWLSVFFYVRVHSGKQVIAKTNWQKRYTPCIVSLYRYRLFTSHFTLAKSITGFTVLLFSFFKWNSVWKWITMTACFLLTCYRSTHLYRGVLTYALLLKYHYWLFTTCEKWHGTLDVHESLNIIL